MDGRKDDALDMRIKKLWRLCALGLLIGTLCGCEQGQTSESGQTALTTAPTTAPDEQQTVILDAPVIIDLSTESGGTVSFPSPIGQCTAETMLLGDSEMRVISQEDTLLANAAYLSPGEYTATLQTQEQSYQFPVYVVTMQIRNAADLKKATLLPDGDTGYFVLTNNIDCSELSEPICFLKDSYFETALGEGRQGFRGCFNGMGYTLFCLQVPKYGLFGCIGNGGVVKDLGFKDIYAEGEEGYAVCKDSAGTICQVYVQGSFNRVLFASYGPGNQLKNIVAEPTGPDSLLCQHIASVDTDGYSVSDINGLLIVGENAGVSGWSRTKQYSSLTKDLTMYIDSGTSLQDMTAVTSEYGFDRYWDISSGFPIFLSSVE